MTKDEYEDFVLRYKGCGACFPMYHTLSRFEKMWFSAIQKDVAELEKENADLERKLEQTENDLTDYQFNYPTIKELQKENAELKDNFKIAKDNEYEYSSLLTKAKKLLKRCYDNYIYLEPLRSEIAQFLSEVDK